MLTALLFLISNSTNLLTITSRKEIELILQIIFDPYSSANYKLVTFSIKSTNLFNINYIA